MNQEETDHKIMMMKFYHQQLESFKGHNPEYCKKEWNKLTYNTIKKYNAVIEELENAGIDVISLLED